MSTTPLRILLTWRPDADDNPQTDAAEYIAWLARTQPVLVRTATVISRVWSPRVPKNADAADKRISAKAREDYEQWLAQESAACQKKALSALRHAGVPESMLDETPAVVTTDHSETTALITAATEFRASMMVLGSHPAAPEGYFRIGSTADALLHCSPHALGLAPRKPELSKRGVTRVNCAYVDTEQSQQALRLASDLAARWEVPLRLVAFSPRGATMYPTQVPFPHDDLAHEQWTKEAQEILERGQNRALSRHEKLKVELDTGYGYGWGGAMQAIKWKKGDLLVLGSSILGEFNRVFIGPSTNQILRHSPVPVLISPV